MALVAHTVIIIQEHSWSGIGASQLISWSPQYRFTQMWRFLQLFF